MLQIDHRKLFLTVARNMGLRLPRRWFKTKKQMETTRRRSEAAKLGWQRRRQRDAEAFRQLVVESVTEPVEFLAEIRQGPH